MLVSERRERINVQSSSTVELKRVLVDLVDVLNLIYLSFIML